MVRRLGSNLGSRVVNPKWTSYGALEVDIFADAKADFLTFAAALEPLGRIEFVKDLQDAQPFLAKNEALREAISLFNAERFWEAHEVLESLWRIAEGEEKKLLQGLILVCAAFVHAQKDEPAVALGVARRALPQLRWVSQDYYAVDVNALNSKIDRMIGSGKLVTFKL